MDGRPRILVSNDDGHQSEGLKALATAMEQLGEVFVVAPEAEQSASSHAISIHRPLRLRKVRERFFAVDGTPTDCSWLGIHHVMRDRRPDLMVSGINHGPNLADDVTYSGTVSAAMEGTLLGIPSIAVSLIGRHEFAFDAAAEFARRLAHWVLTTGLPPDTLLNVNVPQLAGGEAPHGVERTRMGRRRYGDAIVEKVDPRGRKYYWIGGEELDFVEEEGTDFYAGPGGEESLRLAFSFVSVDEIREGIRRLGALVTEAASVAA